MRQLNALCGIGSELHLICLAVHCSRHSATAKHAPVNVCMVVNN